MMIDDDKLRSMISMACPKMYLYLAASRGMQQYLKEVVCKWMETNNIHIVSRWVTEGLMIGEDEKSAVIDLEDIEKARAVMLFADEVSPGKFTEFGYALRAGKIIFVVGGGEVDSCFLKLPNLRKLGHYMEVLNYL
jgi:hypothetical protein